MQITITQAHAYTHLLLDLCTDSISSVLKARVVNGDM